MLLTISYSESAYPITLVETLKPRFGTILKFVYFLVVNNNNYLSYVVDNIIFGISVPDYPSRNVETTFWDNSEICLLFSRKQQQILSYVVDNIIFGISVPDYPSKTVESKSLRLFCNFGLFCLLYIHINNNKFTYDKFKSAKFGFSILDMF